MDSDTSGRMAPPTQHPDFWFHDRSIILSVQSTLFRVHQTVLSNHSEFFAGLFTLLQPSGEAVIDGCHVVPLYNKVKDVVDLLNAIYYSSHFNNLPPHSDLGTLVDFISGILRLSTKYVFHSLRRRCIFLLLSKFPTSFAAYDMKVASRTHERFSSDSIMRVIHLARENDVLQILPYAYYRVARVAGRRILKHKQSDIDWKIKAMCLVGGNRLRLATMKMSHSFLFNFRPSPLCQFRRCAHARGPHAEWRLLEDKKHLRPLRKYTRWHYINVCPNCVAYCQLQHSNGRKVWDKLPGFFGLRTWDELKSMQDA
ncbi:hypothetical protein K443DRAFT_96264 [Laccaria amethystina LaAM-08-1]|uniref:BTB domain-containing protein n=1 Tax=Laccaria amethystina LaAM-08-1 TaxID=1095629 RepID=A0A0C9XMU2_9AGAR|nr:hypothetical protein K443DRAFT_96264 [Laccaria amethystina LaAM-08-1]